ncbi:MAG: hypothetical protein K2M03_02660 [Muribaculaceae bacterium]|nr:hypothetical protein [Muribaculaceae bacterium]
MSFIGNANANNIPTYSAGDNEELIATFNIPTAFDPDASLNTDADGFKPTNLYSNEHYKGDISHTIFYDFSGNGPITYNYFKTDLTDAQGKSYYPLWLLGMDNIGGDITFTFNQTYIDQYGVNISRVVINGAQNRFSTSPIAVSVNGVEKSLEYTPHSSNIPAGDDTLKSSTTLAFEFPKASPVSEVTVTVSGFGMGFSSIDFYVGEPQTVITPVETISFIGLDDTQVPLVLPYSDSPVTLLPFRVLIDGTPSDEAYNRVTSYTIYDDKEVKIDEVSVNSTGNTQYSFETEGRYYIGVTDSQTEVEARYILELFTKLDNLPILGASMTDGIITIEQYIIDDENNATKRDLTAVPLFDVPDDMELYCRVWHDDTFMSEPDNGNEKPEYTPGIILLDDERADIPEGFNRYDSQKGLNLEGGNTIDTIVHKNGVLSPTQSVRYTTIPNVPTAVTTINAAGTIPVPAYHIDGRHANQSSKGLIIELTPDGHARKVIR